MTGDKEHDALTLCARWEMSKHAFDAWHSSVGTIGVVAMDAAVGQAKRLMHLDGMTSDAVITAVSMAFCGSLFAYIKTLPHPEAVFILEEIAQQTDLTVQFMKTEGN